jgi:hypothetical protein
LETQPEAFERRRAVERKHGRVAMAAVVGTIVHNNHIVFDGYLSPSANLKFSDVPTGADGIRAIPAAGLAQIFLFFALVELAWMPASKYDGDYGVGWFGGNIKDPEEKARKLNVELNNGRAAMMGKSFGVITTLSIVVAMRKRRFDVEIDCSHRIFLHFHSNQQVSSVTWLLSNLLDRLCMNNTLLDTSLLSETAKVSSKKLFL